MAEEFIKEGFFILQMRSIFTLHFILKGKLKRRISVRFTIGQE